jgi:hypothetical protein
MAIVLLALAIAAIALSVIALAVRRWWILALGVLAGSPLMLYLFTTSLWPAAVVTLAAHAGAAQALRKKHVVVAWILFAPMPATTASVSLLFIGATMDMYGM